MVAGVDRFRAHFSGHEHQYVLIGGAACELIMEEAGLDFRATKDLDIALIVEALDPAFSETFVAFVEAGGYEIRQRSEGARPRATRRCWSCSPMRRKDLIQPYCVNGIR